MEDLKELLHPKRFSDMSGKMAALVACVIGAEGWTVMEFDDLAVTSDGYLLAQEKGDAGYNHFLGRAEDFDNNVRMLIKAAGLNEAQTRAFEELVKKKVKRS